jgi:hypothetical protein
MKKVILSLLVSAAMIQCGRASIVFSENFSYPDGGIVSNSAGIWIFTSGTAGTMVVSNNALVVAQSRSEDIAHQFTSPFPTNGTVPVLYSSFKVMFTGLPNQVGTYFTHFTGEAVTSAFRARVWAATTNLAGATVAAPGFFYIGIGNNSPSGASPTGPTSGQISTALTTNIVYTIVTRYVITNNVATIWVNPNLETDPGATADDSLDPTNYVNVTYYGFRQAGNEGTISVDDFKVGTAFSDVAGANTAPVVSSIPDQAIPAGGTTGPLPFTVSDAETVAGSLNVTAVSSNTVLVPNGGTNIVLGGSATNRTIAITPVAGQQGAATITIIVSDGVNTSLSSFDVTVGAPFISAIPNQIFPTNTTVPAISFTVGDAESDSLTFTASSSNTNVLLSSNILFGGSGSNRTVTLTPEAGIAGVTTVTIFVSDTHTTNASHFTLTMRPVLGLVFSDDFAYTNFVQPNALYLAEGSPWSTIPPGTAFQVQVTNGLAYLNHTNTEDLGASLTNGPYFSSNAVVFYTSFTVNFSFLPSPSGNYFEHLKSSASDTVNFRARVFANTANAAAGKFRLGIANNSAAISGQFPQDLDTNTTYTVVTRFNSGTGETVLWVNPVSEGSTYVAATDASATGTIGGVALREDTGMGDLAMGPLKIGTSFSDVLTVTVPTAEPLQIGLAGGQVVLSWTNSAFSLASASVVTGPYNKILGATSPYTNGVTGDQKYFRLVWP